MTINEAVEAVCKAHITILPRDAIREILEAAAPIIRAEALEDAAKDLEWVKPDSSPCGDTETCCGSVESCDAMRPSVFVASPVWLRARAVAERDKA